MGRTRSLHLIPFIAVPLALNGLTPAIAQEPEAEPASVAVVAPVDAPDHERMHRPAVRDALPSAVFSNLLRAFPVAVAKVRTVPSCRTLFERLGADPVVLLLNSRYMKARPKQETITGSCQTGAAAVTAVGSPEVRLCMTFGSLPTVGAALVLLHEALHYGGLGEWPTDPGGMTREQINRMVRDGCQL